MRKSNPNPFLRDRRNNGQNCLLGNGFEYIGPALPIIIVRAEQEIRKILRLVIRDRLNREGLWFGQ